MSCTQNKSQVFLTLLNIQAVPYGVHERNTIGYLVAFESRRAAAIAVAAASPRAAAAASPSKQTFSCFHIVFMECLPHSCQSQYGGQEMWESKTSSSTITVYVRTVNSPALVARSACGAIREGTDDLE